MRKVVLTLAILALLGAASLSPQERSRGRGRGALPVSIGTLTNPSTGADLTNPADQNALTNPSG